MMQKNYTPQYNINQKRGYTIFSFLILGSIFLFFKNPYPNFGDTLGFLWQAKQGFSLHTNATAHFLYQNILSFLHLVFPFINIITLFSLFTIFCALLTLLVFHHLLNKFGFSWKIRVLAILMLGLSFNFWRWTEIFEVYALSNLVFLLMVNFALQDTFINGSKTFNNNYIATCATLGIALLIHIQHVLFLPFFAYYTYLQLGNKKALIKGLGLFLGIVCILFVLPLIFNTHSLSAILFDSHYQDEVLNFSLTSVIWGFVKSLAFLFYQYHVFLIFIGFGLYRLFKQSKSLFWQLMLILAPYWLFAMRYEVGDSYVFFLPAYIILGLIGAWGIYHIACYYRIFYNVVKFRFVAIAVSFLIINPLVYFTALQAGYHITPLQQLHQEKQWKGGLKLYLFPGMRHAKNPLEVAKEVHTTQDSAKIEKWYHYQYAIEYLKAEDALNSPK